MASGGFSFFFFSALNFMARLMVGWFSLSLVSCLCGYSL